MASRRSVGYNGEEDRGGDKRKKKQAYVPLFAWIKGKVFWQARELQTVTNDIFTNEDGKLLVKHGDLPEECIRAAEIGGCPRALAWICRSYLTCTKLICYSMNLEEALSLLNPT
ncbi:hypothetical protein BRADI_3g43570v3 [Brachypodium distachyon]|uniref:Uncharacterized protein n=1 Tax=Brachypodium distachyon TaxID=15368 RepID=A0A0Q3QCJ3_BRADI|nr:hypothetical protein BRADI_3g43570v3 [Brachypodium distachyon]KQJ99506.1 hypothetical protein BRADI_3g43570v3 [Brachypodium distachyon]